MRQKAVAPAVLRHPAGFSQDFASAAHIASPPGRSRRCLGRIALSQELELLGQPVLALRTSQPSHALLLLLTHRCMQIAVSKVLRSAAQTCPASSARKVKSRSTCALQRLCKQATSPKQLPASVVRGARSASNIAKRASSTGLECPRALHGERSVRSKRWASSLVISSRAKRSMAR
jgi:hypothetical protein